LLLLVVASSLATAAVPAHAGPATTGAAIGFARVNLGDGTVAAFGGKGTKSVSTGPTGGPGLAVSFVGKFPKDLTPDQVIVQATAEAFEGNLAVANAVVSFATKDQVIVNVNGWLAGTSTPVDGYVFLTVYSGVAPKE
jgi:hypothetical protein